MASRIRRPALWAGCVSLAFVATVAATAPAPAQDRPRNLLDMLFGNSPQRQQVRPAQRVRPQAEPPRRAVRRPARERGEAAQRPRQNRRSTAGAAAAGVAGGGAAAAATAAAAPVAKSETARTVLVVGDFMAGALARGLEDAFAQNRDIRVAGRAEGSSGLVRDDHYDWPARIGPLVAETEPAAVVVMLGANDRQSIRGGAGGPLALRSQGWAAEYEARVDALADRVRETGLPLLWVGMPPFGIDRASEDMVYFNDLYRRAATRVGGEFVDVWGGFADADGAFVSSGPDASGRNVRLRGSDGIGLTAAGRDKLAWFVERPITKRLGLDVGDFVASLGPQQLAPGELPAPGAAADTRSVGAVSLAGPALDGGEALLGGGAPPSTLQGSPGQLLVGEGRPAAPAEGRADRFSTTGRGEAVSPTTRDNAIVFRGSTSIEDLRRRPEGEAAAPAEAPAPPAAPATTPPAG